MTRQFSILGVVLLSVSLSVAAGCRPQQPFYFLEDGDLSHYIGVATEIEYPDVEAASLDEVNGAMPPLTLENSDPREIWELPLEEAVQIALKNSKVIRNLGGVAFGATGAQGEPSSLLLQPATAGTIYNPALEESNPRFGVEAALAAFDAQFSSSVFWEKNDTPQNTAGFLAQFRPQVFQQDLGTFQARLAKTTAPGTTFSLTHNVNYELNNIPVWNGATGSRVWGSDWNVNVEAQVRHPWLRGGGVQFNRIAGPGAIPGFNNGVMIARLRTDQSLADFEAGVRNLVNDVEKAYWELYYAYRALDAAIAGRDAVLQLWRERKAEEDVGKGGRAEEAQARQQYFLFRAAVERSLSNLYKTENHLRYMMGLAATDARLIRPADDPTTARVDFDWYEAHAEALARSVELRKQKWVIKQRELELISAKNYLLPRLDTVARYRWLGLGNHLIDPHYAGQNTADPRNNAYGSMTAGDYQEWQLGIELDIPIGFRKEMAGVRHAQLNLARERAVLQEQELELSHQLSQAIRKLDENYVLSQTNFNRRIAALDELSTTKSKFEYGQRDVTFAQVLDAQRRLAEAEIDYFRAIVDYNLAIAEIHLRKGSLLEYNGVYLAEGPWPEKAYFDAHRRARARDASLYLDYGFTRPKVISRGEYDQQAGGGGAAFDTGLSFPTDVPRDVEVVPTPAPLPMEGGSVPHLVPEPETSSGRLNVEGPGRSGLSRREGNSNSGVSRDAKAFDLAKTNLDGLAAKPAGARATPASSKGPVLPASYQQHETTAGSAESKRSVNSGWKSSRRSGIKHESVANHPTAEADRNPSGWKRVQH